MPTSTSYVHGRKTCRFLIGALVLCVLGMFGGHATDALAQSSGGVIRPAPGTSKNFNPLSPLLKLFGVNKPRKSHNTRRQQNTVKANRPRDNVPRFIAEPKDPDAGVVLVVGDRMARGVAEGLTFTLADKPMVRIETILEEGQGLAGFVAPDWSAKVLARIRGDNVKAVVVMMGKEDLGAQFPGKPPVEFATSAWWEEYNIKVAQLVTAIRQERKPLVWVGLAPTGSETTNVDFLQMNEVFRAKSDGERGHFVDVWEIFLSDTGEYTSYGPDVEGKNRRLRTSDKVGFTWTGYRKLAFFVERQLSRILGGYGGLAFEGVEDDPNFIVLTGRTTSPEDELLGEDGATSTPEVETSAYRFFVKGEPLPPMPGRVDSVPLANGAGGF
ncbi:DUF459 domain-containing protein [Roseibium algae]|uniref:DUF459 domain-containing protein n=1 Tax=Roseibium algae TaxID=3123038 RepID=A0ABU8TG40_9HYPH